MRRWLNRKYDELLFRLEERSIPKGVYFIAGVVCGLLW